MPIANISNTIEPTMVDDVWLAGVDCVDSTSEEKPGPIMKGEIPEL
jgi:hypothetical protein